MNKIVYILEDGRFGGMNKMISDLATEIRKYDFEPFLVVGEQNSAFFLDKLKKQGLPYKTVSLRVLSKNINALFQYLLFFIPDLIKLCQIIRSTRANYVYCNGSQQIKGVIAASLLHKTVIWHIHDTFQPPLLLKIFKLVKAIFGVKNFIASSERTILFYGLDPEKTHVSIPPVNSMEFTGRIEKNTDLNRRKTILTVCNVNTDKGIDTLIRTAAIVNTSRNDVDFKIIGLIPDTQKNYFESLKLLATALHVENISFIGQSSNIFQHLAACDLYLCTSNNESGPISVFEAMAMGIPVVTTDVGDLKNLFTKHKCGNVQPVGDSAALANEILSLLGDLSQQKRISKNVREAVIESIDITICARKQMQYFLTKVN